MKIYFIFNKKSGLPVIVLDDDKLIDYKTQLVKVVDLEELGITNGEFNLGRYRWEGTYDDGRLVDSFSVPKVVVTEEEIDAKYREFLLRKYPLDKILCHLVMNAPSSETDDDFNKIKAFVNMLFSKKAAEIEFYKKSNAHTFESWDHIMERERQALAV